MKLFLCEKPSQAKDIGKVLGVLGGRHDGYFQKDDTVVTWGFGHVLTNAMPEAYGEAYQFGNINALPLIPDEWRMEVPTSVAKQFKVIKGLLARADEVVIATDADREGEVIARELLDYCGYRNKVSRFWTSGLDPASVKKALAGIMPGSKTETLYQAGLARSRADWLVGMNLSRAYTVAYAEGFGKAHTLSIGRIQTPTLNLVVRRDAAIDHFTAYAHYGLSATFQAAGKPAFQAAWQIPEPLRNSDGFCVDKAFVDGLAKQLTGSTGVVVSAETERKKTPPPLPYSLSALQKEVANRFGLSPKKTLDIAQSLYEKHKITSYPRTPCQYLPQSQQADVAQVLAALVVLDPGVAAAVAGTDPKRASRVWNDAQVNKHSHHAIIPTMVTQADMAALNKAERDVYLLIRNRYIAQFYPDYEYDASVIVVEVCAQTFKAHGQVSRVTGWKALLGRQDGEADAETPALPVMNRGEQVQTLDAQLSQKKTTPPPRFTESSLLEEMCTLADFLKTVDDEQIKKILRSTQGLGTEATRGSIIERLFEMGYIEKKKGKLYATDKGKKLIERIPPPVADPVTTAKWELALAGIEAGQVTLNEFLSIQAGLITELVAQAQADAAKRPKAAAATDGNPGSKKPFRALHKAGDVCPDCTSGSLIQREIKDKPEKHYLGCSNYPQCRHFEWLQ